MSFRSQLKSFPYLEARCARAPWPLFVVLAAGISGSAAADDSQAPVPVTPARRQEDPAARERSVGPVRVEKFRRLHWSPDANTLHADGPVTIVYTDPVTKIDTVLVANDLDYDGATSRVRAPGVATLTRPDGRFQGTNIDFNLVTYAGRIENAIVASDYFRMNGDVIEKLPDGSYRLTNGDFTTCIRGTPDYRFHVKDLTFQPDQYIKAHSVRLFLGNVGLPAIPFLRKSLTSGSSFPLPTPGYNKSDGFSLRFQNALVERPYETLDLDLRVNVKRLPTGFLFFQHDLGGTPYKSSPPRILLPTLGDPLSGFLELTNPPTYREYSESHYGPISEPRTTLFASIQNQLFVYNRRRTDLNVTRIPEVGIQFLNILGRPFPQNQDGSSPDSTIPDARKIGIGAAARFRTPNAPALLNVTAGIGQFLENPTKVSSARLGIRANLATQPLLLGRRLSFRAGVSEFLNFYSKGSIYHMIAPEVELDLAPTRDSLFNVGYRYVTDNGRTPFAFDQRDIRHELRLQYQVGGPWAFGVVSKIDLERSRAYDGEIAIARNFDCMQVGVVYRLRSQSFNILFSLLPPRRDQQRPLMRLHGGP